VSARATPVGGPILTPRFRGLLAFIALAVALMAWRFVAGLGATTAMNDGYPWGIWIAFDVVTGTALAAGGYGIALLTYVLNRGHYHALVRPAILTSGLGYTLAGFSIALDVGRFWNLWKVPVSFWQWNLNSALLEVALCVMAYILVLWVEVGHPVLEQWEESKSPLVRYFALFVHPLLRKALPLVIAMGVLLPTLHQSTLGTIFIVSTKLHPLWHSPILPLLFLVSCLGMGYAGVVLESTLSSLAFRRRPEWDLLSRLSRTIAHVLLLFVALRLGDLAVRGKLGLLAQLDRNTFFFVVELVFFLVPAVVLLKKERRENKGLLFVSAMMIVLAGALYRFDVYLIAFRPGPGWSYFPAVPELLITAGLVAIEIAAYIVIVKRFPILSGGPSAAPAKAHGVTP
jgi:Ni/Fe-hydrogenase subunit HybB-like protein